MNTFIEKVNFYMFVLKLLGLLQMQLLELTVN